MKITPSIKTLFAVFTGSALIGAVSVQAAPAREAQGDQAVLFRALWTHADTDKDGQISRAEANAAKLTPLIDSFDAIDTNKDGKISDAELRQWTQANRRSRYIETPRGVETKGLPAPTTQAAQASQAPTAMPNIPPPSVNMNFRSPEQRQAEIQERFNKADTNKDGGLSRDELKAAGFSAFMLDNFDRIDLNKDGKITTEEIRSTWERERKQLQQ